VCDQSADSHQLCRSLEGQVQGNDEEGERAKRRESEISTACKALQEAQTELQRETAEVVRAHADIRNEMESCIASLRPASEWHPTVSGVARDTRQRCDAWLQRHAATATADAFAEARAIRDASVQAVERMKREEHELNGDFAQAEADFHALKALGAALAARAALDAFPWEVRLDQVDADRRRRARRDQWLGTLQVMEQDRADRARTAAATMVDDVDVRARFRRLIDQLQSVHPGLAGLDFRGSSVQAAGQDRGKSLSEGQRVLVNIAAAIAVVGKVLDAASHKPGWIVFDEPTNGLDEQGRRQVASYLGGLSSAEVPCQIVIATFDDQFASCLLEAADKSSRRWKHVALAPYVPGRLVVPVIRSRESA
jgi:DNA repair exonuclease SbcCD ATPase subunit